MYAYGRYEYDDAIKDWNKNTMYHNVLCSRENVEQQATLVMTLTSMTIRLNVMALQRIPP